MQYKLGFIGCGNMGGALVAAAAATLGKGEIAVCDLDENKVTRMEKEYGVVRADGKEIAQNAQFVVLAVKPQVMEVALAPLAPLLQKRTDVTVVTMAAGVSIAGVRNMLGAELPVIRIMPNTPVAVGEGMILYAVTDDVSAENHADFRAYFAKAGKFDQMEESLIDGGSALSGCGPAFVYAFVEALIEGAVKCGVPREKALLYASQTVKGAGEMLLQYGQPERLRIAVCSPGGTTIEGIRALENAGFGEKVENAVLASYKRTLELKK